MTLLCNHHIKNKIKNKQKASQYHLKVDKLSNCSAHLGLTKRLRANWTVSEEDTLLPLKRLNKRDGGSAFLLPPALHHSLDWKVLEREGPFPPLRVRCSSKPGPGWRQVQCNPWEAAGEALTLPLRTSEDWRPGGRSEAPAGWIVPIFQPILLTCHFVPYWQGQRGEEITENFPSLNKYCNEC